jgi:hypothetical protein
MLHACLLVLGAALAFAPPAAAATACAPLSPIEAALASRYGERLVASGAIAAKPGLGQAASWRLYGNEATRTWTWLWLDRAGAVCGLGSGRDFLPVERF